MEVAGEAVEGELQLQERLTMVRLTMCRSLAVGGAEEEEVVAEEPASQLRLPSDLE